MIGSSIKFETFAIDASGRHSPARHTSDELARARSDGFRAGEQAGRAADAAAMVAALEALSRSLAADASRLAACRAETVASLAPVLEAIVDSLADAGPARRLRQALQEELGRLAGRAQQGRIVIAAPVSLHGMISELASHAGLDGIELATAPEASAITISPGTGRLNFSQDNAVAEIRRLIAELQEDAQ